MMSVIVQDENDDIYLFAKGSDDAILPKIHYSQRETADYENIIQGAKQFSREGLRTLMVGMRILDQNEFQQWKAVSDADLRLSTNSIDDNDAFSRLERNLALIGCVALEDRLQEGVDVTIDFIKKSGIQTWMLTGDKLETGICVGYSSSLLQPDMKFYQIQKLDGLKDILQDAIEDIETQQKSKCLLIIGDCFSALISEKEMLDIFLLIASKVDVALGCRFTPSQKEQLVRIYTQKYPHKISLAIGDGANDASMISIANIGIGISSTEQQQAQRSADIVISRFRFLQPLMYIHGRESFRRNTFLVCFLFYKNVLLVFPIFLFGFVDKFRQNVFFGTYLYAFYNVIFTSMPIIWFSFSLQNTQGDTYHYWCLGLIVSGQVITVSNVKVITSYFIFDFIGVIVVILSIMSYYLFIYAFMFIQDEEDESLKDFLGHLHQIPFFWTYYLTFFILLYKVDLIIGIFYQIVMQHKSPQVFIQSPFSLNMEQLKPYFSCKKQMPRKLTDKPSLNYQPTEGSERRTHLLSQEDEEMQYKIL
ncbi:cation transport atpase [Stylonychia lemnae]|uniref:Cation transport atpase n=1 Tax=Stylonychia lemnae TaxID=5949 RepID=A0A077ZT32_STYLE|nr:cation transport atpase [Stylonychia lemnae]|eukprot:CDW72470.1 cation transport atpase [Stylonychia lemnae]